MPVENEKKFVLDAFHLEGELLKMVKDNQISYGVAEIRQGYIVNSKARIREYIWRFCGGFPVGTNEEIDNPEPEFVFTFKQKIKGEMIEIETDIDEEDFQKLWGVTVSKVQKVRFSNNSPLGWDGKTWEVWDIDFFKDSNGLVYFAMAECEMFGGRTEPQNIPDFIKDHILFAPDQYDKKFSSKALADIDYAKKLFEELARS